MGDYVNVEASSTVSSSVMTSRFTSEHATCAVDEPDYDEIEDGDEIGTSRPFSVL